MSTSTYSSSAPWSWTSESGFDSDHDLTLVWTQSEVNLGVQRYLSEKEMGEVAMTSRFAPDFLTNGAGEKHKQKQNKG